MDKKEMWKTIPGYGGRYKISSFGKIVSIGRKTKKISPKGLPYYMEIKEKELKWFDNSFGYKQVNLIDSNGKERKKYVHRLVANAFIENNNNLPEVNHIDGNKANNSVGNLEWVSRSENVRHSMNVLGHKPLGPKARKIRDEITGDVFNGAKEASKKYGISISYVYNQLSGREKDMAGHRFRYME